MGVALSMREILNDERFDGISLNRGWHMPQWTMGGATTAPSGVWALRSVL